MEDIIKLEKKAREIGEKIKNGELTLLKGKKLFKREVFHVNMERHKRKQRLLVWDDINAIWTKYVNDEYGW